MNVVIPSRRQRTRLKIAAFTRRMSESEATSFEAEPPSAPTKHRRIADTTIA